ncbi:hypothetical protein [Hymenobacter convexus]|uniref:hypothetical protein n=1 Tax=Hymenobacter sp. CA1UV-4 TaxID=3063782 RepID=UPI00271281DA|nr:hypothetical protein [Hymenobacter sp. CA1UV-4]MDO7850406.1 hypothetical protein [Hymenobacter sp. CA1UV-4]
MPLIQFTFTNVAATPLADNFFVLEEAFTLSEVEKLKSLYPEKMPQLEALVSLAEGSEPDLTCSTSQKETAKRFAKADSEFNLFLDEGQVKSKDWHQSSILKVRALFCDDDGSHDWIKHPFKAASVIYAVLTLNTGHPYNPVTFSVADEQDGGEMPSVAAISNTASPKVAA